MNEQKPRASVRFTARRQFRERHVVRHGRQRHLRDDRPREKRFRHNFTSMVFKAPPFLEVQCWHHSLRESARAVSRTGFFPQVRVPCSSKRANGLGSSVSPSQLMDVAVIDDFAANLLPRLASGHSIPALSIKHAINRWVEGQRVKVFLCPRYLVLLLISSDDEKTTVEHYR